MVLPVSLTTLIDSTTAFTTAFCLETIVFSRQLWVKLSVAVVLVLAMAILLASWCVGIVIEAKNFSFRKAVHRLKVQLVDFTRSLRGRTFQPNDVGIFNVGMAEREQEALPPGCLREAFGVFRRKRGILTPPTPVRVNPTVNEGTHQPEVEMSEIGTKESVCEV